MCVDERGGDLVAREMTWIKQRTGKRALERTLLFLLVGLGMPLFGFHGEAAACAFCPEVNGASSSVVSFSKKDDHVLVWERDIGSDEGNGGEDRGGGTFYVYDRSGNEAGSFTIDPKRFFWREVWGGLSWEDADELGAFLRHGALPKALKALIKTFGLSVFPARGRLSPRKDRGVVLFRTKTGEGKLQSYDNSGMTKLVSIDLGADEDLDPYTSNEKVYINWSPQGTMLVVTGATVEVTPGTMDDDDEGEDPDEDEGFMEGESGAVDLTPILHVFSLPAKKSVGLLKTRRLAEFYNALGYAALQMPDHLRQEEDEEEARSPLDLYLEAIKADPTYEMAIYNAACAYQVGGQTEEAYKLLERLKKMKTRKAKARLRRARRDSDFKDLREAKRFKALTGKK